MIIIIITAFVITILLGSILASGYVKASPDTAYIISGLRKNPKILIGKAGIKIPFLEKKDELMLKQISVDIKTNGYIPTQDFIGVDIDAVAKVRMLTEEDITIDENGEFLPGINGEDKKITKKMVQAAMKNFLNMGEMQIKEALMDSLQGNMREIIGTQPLKSLCNDRKTFGDEVQAKAQKDMNALGVWIESCNIQKIEDEKGLIIALGQDNMSKIQKDASIAKAQADRDVAIAQAEAEKAANDAKVNAATEIAKKNNELDIQRAELKKVADIKKAEADAAYQIQQEEQRKTIEITTANANIAKQEKEILLKQKEAEVMEQALDAQIKKRAEAEKFAKQQEADAKLYETQKNSEAQLFERQKKAEAEKFEKQKSAEAMKVTAEAQKYAMEQEAEGIRVKGLAEAEAIQAKAVAEAEGIEKKAEAMAKMGQAAVLEMYFKTLPDVVKNAATPLNNVDRITMYGDGNNTKMMKDIMGTVVQVTDGLKESTGVDLTAILSGFLGGTVAKTSFDATAKENTVNNDFREIKEDAVIAEESAVVTEDDEEA